MIFEIRRARSAAQQRKNSIIAPLVPIRLFKSRRLASRAILTSDFLRHLWQLWIVGLRAVRMSFRMGRLVNKIILKKRIGGRALLSSPANLPNHSFPPYRNRPRKVISNLTCFPMKFGSSRRHLTNTGVTCTTIDPNATKKSTTKVVMSINAAINESKKTSFMFQNELPFYDCSFYLL